LIPKKLKINIARLTELSNKILIEMKEIILRTIRPIYYWLDKHVCSLLEYVIPSKILDYKKVPIIINNRNRFTYLKMLIDYLEKRGYTNIYIIDNNSSYSPLLKYYDQLNYKVYFLKRNVGYLALWKTGIFLRFIRDYYVYTDPDVVPVEECPDDFMAFFLKVLEKHKTAKKVGFSLKIDDLPDHYNRKQEVIDWEKSLYLNKLDKFLYQSPVDTTFALYRPWAWGGANLYFQTFRTVYPYTARHLPWYEESDNLSEEDLFYRNTIERSTHWSVSKK